MLDDLKASELDLHRTNEARLAQIDRDRIQKKEGREATEGTQLTHGTAQQAKAGCGPQFLGEHAHKSTCYCSA